MSIAGAITTKGLIHFNVKEGAFNTESFETFYEQLGRKLFLANDYHVPYVIVITILL